MNASTKSQVRIRTARDVEPVGLWEYVGIAIGGTNAEGHDGIRGNGLVAERDGFQRCAIAELIGRLESQNDSR